MQKDDTIIQVFWERVKTNPDRPAVMHKVGGAYRPVIWREHGRLVELLAGGLMHSGVQRGDRVAILSNTRVQWTWADIAILSIGGVTVPIYPTLNPPEIDYLLKHSGASGLFLENSRQLMKVLQIGKLPAHLKFIVVMDGSVPVDSVVPEGIRLMSWTDLMMDGEVYLPNHPTELQERMDGIKGEDLATVVYTSGTTGVPKGVMITHRNIHFICETLSVNVGFKPDDLTLSFLPLSHIFERVGGQMLSIYEGLIMAYAESMETVPQNMQEVRPTLMNAVPRFYEKAYNRINSEIRKMPKAQQYLIRWALSLGKRAAKHKETLTNGTQKVVDDIYRTELRVADRLVFAKIRRRFGGRLRFLISGAAPLSTEVQQFFETIGMPIIEGYGLTETAAPVACNRPNNIKRGTVGQPLPGLDVKIAEDGEILVKGPSVFVGYYRDEAATKEAFKDGYFCTGDIGTFDEQGFLKILDRKKDLIITAGGKHIAPQYIENLFAGERVISRVLVYGDKRKYVTALITLASDSLESFANSNGISFSSVEELHHHPLVREEVESAVKRVNERLASFEQIKKYLILEEDFTIENNELTPTMKMRRKIITEKYKQLLDSLYDVEDLKVVGEGVGDGVAS
jgi:long-chain acyl-CoA synthetase